MEKQHKFQTSNRVSGQLRFRRNMIRDELLEKGISIYNSERALGVFEHKFNEFINNRNKVSIIHQNLSNQRFDEVKSFFNSLNVQGIIQTTPQDSDIEIFSQSLTLPNLYFITTDKHFGDAYQNLETNFNPCKVIHHDNVNQRLISWGW
jgi:hypothetical protein